MSIIHQTPKIGNNLKIIRSIIYQLKKTWGQPLTVYCETSESVDLETGNKTVTKFSVYIRRAVILPSTIHRTFIERIGYLKANSNFTYGGQFNDNTRQLIIDRKDLPHDFEIKATDQYYIVFDGLRYNLKQVQEYDHKLAYYITMVSVFGQDIGNSYTTVIQDTLVPSDSTTGGTQ